MQKPLISEDITTRDFDRFSRWRQESEVTEAASKYTASDHVKNLVPCLQAMGIAGRIIDAGAGLGRNAVYLAKHNLAVEAVEIDPSESKGLHANLVEQQVDDLVSVTSQPINTVLRKAITGSVAAIIDYGMSSYLSEGEISEYRRLLEPALTPHGIIVMHFPDRGITSNGTPLFLEQVISLDKFIVLFARREYKQLQSGNARSWTVTLVKREGQEDRDAVLEPLVSTLTRAKEKRAREMLGEIWEMMSQSSSRKTTEEISEEIASVLKTRADDVIPLLAHFDSTMTKKSFIDGRISILELKQRVLVDLQQLGGHDFTG